MTESRPSRRRVMAVGVATSTLLLAGPLAVSGCTSSAPPGPPQRDPLELPAEHAEADAALAQSVAAVQPALADVAGTFAADRRAHAAALRAELRRVVPSPAPSSPALPAAPVPPPADWTQARDALARAMRTAQDEAAGLVPGLPGYRAALLASVAACCASHAAVLPPPTGMGS